jgi:hypothetical protein
MSFRIPCKKIITFVIYFHSFQEMPTEWPFKFIKPKKHWNPETGKDDLLICLGDNKGKTRSKEKPKDIEDAIEKLKNIYKS